MTLDRETVDNYLTILEAHSPEDALTMWAAYENLVPGDEDEWVALLIELLEAECDLKVDKL